MKAENLTQLIKKIKLYDGYIQHFLDKEYEGSCPCFWSTIEIGSKKLYVHGRCWRVSDNAQDLHVWGDYDEKTLMKVAKVIKKRLDEQEWYNPYTIILEKC